MKKTFILFQWAVVIALALFSFRMLTRPVPPPHRQPETWNSWAGFHALSFAGITRKATAGCITRDQLARHLEALNQAGYHTIFPEDALAFLEGRHPLPERAVLLLFEGGRKDSYVHATPLLRRARAVGTLLAPTARVESWSSFFLRPRDLKKSATDPNWRLASMGHRAAETSATTNGATIRYLSQRLNVEGRPEGDEAYRARIISDVAEASHLLRSLGAPERMAYLLPYADDGTGPEADPLAAAAIAESIALFHDLAFTRADMSFNGPFTNPRRASRIRVAPDWDATQLLAALDADTPRDTPVTQVDDGRTWSFEGDAETSADRLRLQTGTRAWLRGSDEWADATVTIALQPEPPGNALVYLRHAGPEHFVRLRVGADGVALQEKIGDQMQTLAAWNEATTLPATFTLRLRGNRVWLMMNDEQRAGPIPLTRATARGRIGLEAEDGACTVTRFTAERNPATLALARNGFQSWAEADRLMVRTLVIPWFEATKPPVVRDEEREAVLQAAAAGMTLVPRIDGGQDLTPVQAQRFVTDLAKALDHVMTRSLVRQFALPAGDATLADALHNAGYGVVRVLEAKELATLPPTPPRNPGDAWVLLMADPETWSAVQPWATTLPAHRVAVEFPPAAALPAGVSPVLRFNL